MKVLGGLAAKPRPRQVLYPRTVIMDFCLLRPYILRVLSLHFLCYLACGAHAQQHGSTIVRVTATPVNKAAGKQAPVKHMEPVDNATANAASAPNGGMPDQDDFMLKYNYLFGAHGKLRPTPTPVPVAEDKKTTAQRVAEMVREMRARSELPPARIDPEWVQSAKQTPSDSYVAPTPKPVVRIATPPPKSKLPNIDLGGDGSSQSR